MYKYEGYSVLAYTDHNDFYNHNDLSDPDFLVLNGCEPGVDEPMVHPDRGRKVKTCHFCVIALDKNRTEGIDTQGRTFGYNTKDISEYFALAREQGFFVTYNHPVWSLERYPTYMNYNNMNAFEIYYQGCITYGYPEYNQQIYDDMLIGGKRLYCIAADDSHGTVDAFGGYVMIKADSLTYEAVTDALVKGNFYACCGRGAPEIKELYVEDGVATVVTSPAKYIYFNTGGRGAKVARGTKEEPVTTCSFKINPDCDGYIRVTVTDFEGNHANSNAYFVDEIFE